MNFKKLQFHKKIENRNTLKKNCSDNELSLQSVLHQIFWNNFHAEFSLLWHERDYKYEHTQTHPHNNHPPHSTTSQCNEKKIKKKKTTAIYNYNTSRSRISYTLFLDQLFSSLSPVSFIKTFSSQINSKEKQLFRDKNFSLPPSFISSCDSHLPYPRVSISKISFSILL